jgi:hypothetical protein
LIHSDASAMHRKRKKIVNLLHTCGRTAKTDGNTILPLVCDLKPKINPLLPVRRAENQTRITFQL